MKREELKARIEAANREMAELLQERMLLDLRLSQLTDTIKALESLLAQRPAEPRSDVPQRFIEEGVTGAIRLLLANSKLPLSPVQIRDELANHGFNMSDYANKMAVIHNTLKRLERQGEVTVVQNPAGQVVGYLASLKK